MSIEQRVRDAAREIGESIALDVLAEDMPRDWAGLDAQDVDKIPDDLREREGEIAAMARGYYFEFLRQYPEGYPLRT